MENSRTNNFYKKLRNIFIIAALVVVSGNIGFRLGNKQSKSEVPAVVIKPVINSAKPDTQSVDFSIFWDVWKRLEVKFLDKTKIDTQKMVYGAISGMVGALGDPYTVFLPPKENGEFKQDLSGNFEGIGAQLGSKEDKIVVIAPLKDHPAEKAGILAGDWIVKVDGTDTLGWTVPQTVNKIRGPKGTKVKLTIYREDKSETIDFSVIRDKITVKSVELEIKAADQAVCVGKCKSVAVIKLTRFGDQTNEEWNSAIATIRQELNQKNIKGIVLDMRNNPGGYFQSAIYIASEFLKNGVVVIQENSDGTKETFSVNRVGNFLNIPLTVLVNRGSASAAEIVAGALKDHGRAKLVGEATFGKGSIQTPEDLPDGSGLHITTARWVMPNGGWLNGKGGIIPDIEIKTPEATDSADLQLEKAIDELL